MVAIRRRRRGSVVRPLWGLAAGIALGVIGLVAMYRSMNPEEEGAVPALLGVSLETPWPGVLLLIVGLALAAWSMRAMHKVGSREPRTDVRSWTLQPPPGAKEFGHPPVPPSHRAELAAAGLEAHPLSGGHWGVRRIAR